MTRGSRVGPTRPFGLLLGFVHACLRGGVEGAVKVCVLLAVGVLRLQVTCICFRAVHLQVARDKLVALGTCIGKLTHTGKFRLTIGALDLISQYAKYKVSDGAA